MRTNVRRMAEGRRGSALATAILFTLLIAVAGTALLSISLINRTNLVRNGIDVRLMIASEAAVETLRGRFTLIQGVQDDWNFLSPTAWSTVGTPTVNGLPVTVEAMSIGGPSVPTARIRARATASNRTRVVEYLIKVATFSDYAVFTGRDMNLGANYKAVGNVYGEGNINIASPGAQMLGQVTITGTINKTNGEPDSYTFPVANPLQNQPVIPFPTWAAPWEAVEDVARAANHVHAENTLEIRFDGTDYLRTYVRRTTSTTGTVTVPSGLGWINRATGATDYTHSSLNNTYYQVVVNERIPIPDEGVIYVRSGPARTSGKNNASTPTKDAVGTPQNYFTQTRVTGTSGDDQIFYDNYFSRTTPVLMISGTISNRRVSLACDHKIIIKSSLRYQSLLDNPEYRRFQNDGVSGKEGAGALGFKEMLGVMAKGDIHPAVTWWNTTNALPVASNVLNLAGEYLPGHYTVGGQYSMDGVFMSLGALRPYRNYGYTTGTGPLGELWIHGGLIAQGDYGAGHANSFIRRNYDWDFRMRLTCPPYFLRAYNTSAVFIPGSWRTYEV